MTAITYNRFPIMVFFRMNTFFKAGISNTKFCQLDI